MKKNIKFKKIELFLIIAILITMIAFGINKRINSENDPTCKTETKKCGGCSKAESCDLIQKDQ